MVIARTVGIFLGLAVLSFVLGFFVLAKVVPGAPRSPMASALPATDVPAPISAETGVPRDIARTAGTAPEHGATPTQVGSAKDAPKPRIGRGPSLDPETDAPAPSDSAGVQAPRKVGPDGLSASSSTDSTKESAASGDAPDGPAPKSALTVQTKHRRRASAHKSARTSNSPDDAVTGSDETTSDASESATAKPPKSRRTSASADENDDNADANAAGPERSGPSNSDDSAGRGTLYHVRLGSFHSREAAENEVERARAKGFPTRVVPVTRHGHTLYRVQAGAFRDRDRAEAIRQSLQDASLDASVSEQRH